MHQEVIYTIALSAPFKQAYMYNPSRQLTSCFDLGHHFGRDWPVQFSHWYRPVLLKLVRLVLAFASRGDKCVHIQPLRTYLLLIKVPPQWSALLAASLPRDATYIRPSSAGSFESKGMHLLATWPSILFSSPHGCIQ